MAENSKIEWTEATWNPMAGCSIVSPGCHNCYAMRTAYRLAAMGQKKYQGTTEKKNGRILWTGKINTDESALSIPLKKKKPTTWFVNSMSDLFHESVPFDYIDKVFAVMALCPQHTFQVLTKRPERMAEYMNLGRFWQKVLVFFSTHPFNPTEFPLPNVFLGTSCEDQQRADKRIPHLLRCPAAVKFVSAEPLLGGIDLVPYMGGATYQCSCGFHRTENEMVYTGVGGYSCVECREWCLRGPTLDWVIAGGESGPSARPMHPDWVRSIRDQCVDTGTAFFFKQWGAWEPAGSRGTYCFNPGESIHDLATMNRVGKKKAGRLLDGREWNELPHVAVT